LGRLTRDPELKEAKGLSIANFSIATSKEWKNEAGEKQEKAEFHNCVAFKKTAELVGKYLTKGRQVYIEGELQTRSWDDEKTGVKKYKTEIIANNIQFVGDNKQANAETMPNEKSSTSAPPNINASDEIPF